MVKYIAIYSLVKDIEDLKDGANIHDINSLLNIYYIQIRQYNKKYIYCLMEDLQKTENKIRQYIEDNS